MQNIPDPNPPLESARLALEPVNGWHGEPMFAGLKDPLLYTYIPKEPPLAASHVSRRFEALEQRRSPDGAELWLNWAVRLKSNGYVGLVEATVYADGQADIAWMIFTPHQRQGLGAEAVGAMLEHLGQMGVRAVRAFIDTRNAASIALAERCGLTRIATHRAREKLRGRPVDDHEYGKALA